MIWEQLTIKIDTDPTSMYSITSQSPFIFCGSKTITGNGTIILTSKELELLDDLDNFNKSLEDQYIKVDENIWYKLKSPHITSYVIDLNPGINKYIHASVEYTAEDAGIAYINVKFEKRRNKIRIKYGDYIKITENYGSVEKMTYDEFKDKLMVENL